MKIAIVLAAVVVAVSGHATLMEPVNRNSAWRKGFPGPIDYSDMSDECGRSVYGSEKLPGSCTICGPISFPKDGVIVKTYKAGQKIDIEVLMNADHRGYYTFRICPNANSANEQCFEQHRLPVFNSPIPQSKEHFDRYEWQGNEHALDGKTQHIQSQIPGTLRCEHCVFQWTWWCNNAGPNQPAQIWRQCSDIKIE